MAKAHNGAAPRVPRHDRRYDIRGPRFTPVGIVIVLFSIAIALTIWVHADFGWLAAVVGILVLIGIVDAVQTRRSVRRNYPLFGRLRWVGEQFRPEIHIAPVG